MDADVVRLMEESGPLVGVKTRGTPGARFRTLLFEFTAGLLHLRCNDDTDEIVVEVVGSNGDHTVVEHGALSDLTGMTILYAWSLTNHRGYADAFQLQFADGQGREETRQFEVAASEMDVRRVTA